MCILKRLLSEFNFELDLIDIYYSFKSVYEIIHSFTLYEFMDTTRTVAPSEIRYHFEISIVI